MSPRRPDARVDLHLHSTHSDGLYTPAQVVDLALGVIRADRFPQLATIDGDQPRLRPVSPVRTDRFTVYVANLRAYHKTAEIAANPKVELCYLDAHHNQARFQWHATAPDGTEPAYIGFDVLVTDKGRVRNVYGFLDKVPSGPVAG